MREISRAALFGKLNRLGYDTVEKATALCEIRGNPYVELVHWVHQLWQLPDSDLHRVANTFRVDASRLEKDLIESLAILPRGATSVSDFSYHVQQAVERGWTYATLMFGDSQIRTGHLVLAILMTPSLRNVFLGISREFNNISVDQLGDQFEQVVAGSPEDALHAVDGFRLGSAEVEEKQAEAGTPTPAAQLGKYVALDRYSVDLTAKARAGELDPIVGRDAEIRQIVHVLMRRRQNNPILTGEAGVGKTAVVEGFATRIASGDVPPSLKGVSLRALDIGLLQAGAGVRGEFEKRLRQVIEEVESSPRPIILFIDEAHTLVGAGGAAGTGDAANLLKPALARGTLRTIAATTWAEYKEHFEGDAALTRRFQVVHVEEPDEKKAVLMVRGLNTTLEKHHQVHILDNALEAAVKLSRRYIPARQLPDKAVSLLDTAAARVAVSQHGVPAPIEDSRNRLKGLQTEQQILEREKAVGIDTTERQAEISTSYETEQAHLQALEERWGREKDLVDQILKIRRRLQGKNGAEDGLSETSKWGTEKETVDAQLAETPSERGVDDEAIQLTEEKRQSLLARLKVLQGSLSKIQGEEPLMLTAVDAQALASVIADWTGIPVGRMVKDEIRAVLDLAESLRRRVIGQDHALEMIAKRVQTSRAELENPNKPIGVFLLCGPSGVGKTETGLALAEALYGGEENIITINMSEFQERHTVSTLKGAPPGYKGYGKGGVLTEAIRRRPYSVVLLDEVEKAHSDVHEVFYQVFDKGAMEDAEGRRIDFKNTLILLTSNVGSELITSLCEDPELLPDPEQLSEATRKPLLEVFPPALLGRLVVIPYFPLSEDMIERIIRLQLGRIEARLAEHHRLPFTYDDSVVTLVKDRCSESESGARMIDSILTNTLLPAISRELLERKFEGHAVPRVHVTVEDGDFNYNFE